MPKVKLNKKPLHDITGRRFGYLEVLRMEVTKNSHGNEWRAICKCHLCGREDFECRPAAIKNPGKYKNYKSCGCDKSHFISQTGKNSVNFKGYEEMNSWYLSDAKRRSKKLNIPFNLNMRFLWKLYLKQNKKCALSGLDINFAGKRNNITNGNISLDRIDSKKGYIKTNVQWVHKNVNLMKMYMEESVFLCLCKQIYLNGKNHIDTQYDKIIIQKYNIDHRDNNYENNR